MSKLQVAILTFFLTSALWLVIGSLAAGFAYVQFRSPGDYDTMPDEFPFGVTPDFEVTVEHPAQCRTGEEVAVAVAVRNAGTVDAVVGSIDIYDSFLDGFEVVSVDPEVESRTGIFEFTTFGFSEPLPAGESWSVTFTLRAKEAGTFEGDLDVCDPEENYVSRTLKLEVLDP